MMTATKDISFGSMKSGRALPEKWRIVHLNEAAEIVMGNSPPGDSYNENGIGMPLVNGPVEFGSGPLGLTLRSKFTTSPTKLCRAGDLLVCVRGSTTGRTNVAAFDACIGRGVAAIRAFEYQPFLNHFICTQRRSIFDSGNGSTFPSISQQQLSEIEIPLPPLSEQRRIADILEKADAIRRKRHEVHRQLSGYAHAVFGALFGHPESNRCDWPTMRFADVCESRLGKMIDAKQQTGKHRRPYMRNLNIGWGRIDLSEVFEMDFDANDREEFRLLDGDVLVCEGGAGVGQTAIWRNQMPECYFQKSLHRVRPRPGLATPEYIAALMWVLMQGSSLLRSISSATIPHLTGEKLKEVLIPVPPLKLQEKFASIVRKSTNASAVCSKQVGEADTLFSSLIQRAFRGEL